MTLPPWPVLAALGAMSVLGLALMGLDKRRARRRLWRVPEKTLLAVALLGGAAGVWIGLYLFRHKTRHLLFVLGVPTIFLAHVICILLLW
ncbi:MAG: DUF1294 domain-containing protein [Clostridiaceae bacterium]|jgi:uncharacterized membrane protein YsdA (DUF1294 family)|nr:DUF1294 domain-containing protein [Clostridiaceae bacterium]